MELFNVINYQQKFGEIKIQEDILKTNPNWKKHFQEIELRNFQDVKVNIYYHRYVDFLKIFKNLEFNYYLLEKEKNQFITIEKYIQRKYFADIKILENILFSKNSQEEHNGQLRRDVEISHFPKHFVSLSDDLIYTYEKREENVIDYVFIIGQIDFYQYAQQDYFYSLYKFLKEEVHSVFTELEKSHIATEEQKLNEDKLLSQNKFSDFLNEVEVFKADKLSDFAINIGKNGNHDYSYFLDFINSTENRFDNFNLTKYVVVSYFTEDEIITYLQYSFRKFKEKYIYATTSDYFGKNDDFKFLASRIKEIDHYILGNNVYQDSYSFRPKDKFKDYGKYKNHLVYYYGKIFYFFDSKYFNSDNIDMHFKHMNKIFDRDSENLSRRHTTGYKGDGLEKRITAESKIDVPNLFGATGELTAKTLSVPQKIKILDELNIKGWLQEKGFTIFQIEQLLSDLFDRTDKTIRDSFSNNKHEDSSKDYLVTLKALKAKR